MVTGAGRGLGAGIARCLAADGATVICADRTGGVHTAGALGSAGIAALLDVADPDACTRVIDDIVSNHGQLDILVCNAGVNHPIAEVTTAPLHYFYDNWIVNTMGVVHCVQAAVPYMRAAGWGRIINTASVLGKVGVEGLGPYCASKFAVVALTECLARELASDGITVNSICPGTMDTPMIRDNIAKLAEGPGPGVAERMALIAAGKPMRRLGTPDDIGRLVAFLASDDASFTTGASFNLSGGEWVFF